MQRDGLVPCIGSVTAPDSPPGVELEVGATHPLPPVRRVRR